VSTSLSGYQRRRQADPKLSTFSLFSSPSHKPPSLHDHLITRYLLHISGRYGIGPPLATSSRLLFVFLEPFFPSSPRHRKSSFHSFNMPHRLALLQKRLRRQSGSREKEQAGPWNQAASEGAKTADRSPNLCEFYTLPVVRRFGLSILTSSLWTSTSRFPSNET